MKEDTRRSLHKAERRQQLLGAAARLFADRGFRSVSIEDLGAAVGVSGPAVYRYFASKEELLSELLVSVSRRLLEEGAAHVRSAESPYDALRRLVTFHADFALEDRDLIRIQDHDLVSLPPRESKVVRHLQRSYMEVWIGVLLEIDPSVSTIVAQTKAQAIFGLLNSTPHSAANRDVETSRRILEELALSALLHSLSSIQVN